MTHAVLEAHRLRRVLGTENHVAVADVSLHIDHGQVVCLLGPNGAGKTTTVKMCATLLIPTAGSIRVNGVDAISAPNAARRHLGLVLGGDRGFYTRASALENLLFFGDVLGVGRRSRRTRAQEALEAVGLADRAGHRVEAFSRGMRQRLHIARGLLNRPDLLLLDEPTNGLDPEIASDIRALVSTLAAQGTGILLTTHYLREAELLADELMLIQQGRVTASGGAEDLARRSGVHHVTTLTASFSSRSALAELSALANVVSVQADVRDQRTQLTVAWSRQPDEDALTRILERDAPAQRNVLVEPFTRGPTLEESYLALVSAGPGEPGTPDTSQRSAPVGLQRP